MSKDSDEKDFEKLEDEVYHLSNEFNRKTECNSKQRPAKFGLCSNCTYFHYQRTLYGNESAICSKYKARVPSQDRIIECTDYYPFDQPDIYDLTRIAHIIEAKKERKIGF
jgi:hypothetical protein